MATNEEQTFQLRLLVDEQRNRVVLAEASGEFIDTLFSFFTLPLGTIIRLVSKNDQPQDIGCISNLYHSVQSCSNEVFWNQICKQMLLCPRNHSESLCKKLKLNVDDTEPLRYFICGGFCKKQSSNPIMLSTFAGASCSSCGKLMDKEMKLFLGDSREESTHHDGGVFVKGDAMFLVCDDLKVTQSSPNNFVKELVQLGYKNFNKLTEIMLPNVGLKEILDLLMQALTSKSPLSDVFLGNCESTEMYNFSPKIGPEFDPKIYHLPSTMNLKVIVRKSKKKILYAEAEGHFVDFLFSFLTAPLGSILKLLDGNSSLGCIDKLYKSVKNLDSSWFINPPATPLLDPKVAPQFGFKRQPMKLNEGHTPGYYYGKGVIKNQICYELADGVISNYTYGLQNPVSMVLFDPRSSCGRVQYYALGFVNRPSLFVVWDDLKVTPLANTSSISFMQKMNVSLDDLEEHVVYIREEEALNLLGASLTSKAALTQGLSYLLKKPKEEVN